jgi:CrcB protein
LFVITGFLGGYTTFSAYSLETAQYCINGNIKLALLNMALHNGLSILCVFLGMGAHRLL